MKIYRCALTGIRTQVKQVKFFSHFNFPNLNLYCKFFNLMQRNVCFLSVLTPNKLKIRLATITDQLFQQYFFSLKETIKVPIQRLLDIRFYKNGSLISKALTITCEMIHFHVAICNHILFKVIVICYIFVMKMFIFEN